MTKLQKLSALLSKPSLLHFVLPVLMGYLIIGTVAQKYIGLYQATEMFFAAPVLWIGVIPLPGMPVFVALIFFNLLFKLLFKSPWRWNNAGIIITHIGAMLLLLGGLFTALYSTEGYISLNISDETSTISDYHAREFVVMDENGAPLATFNHKELSGNKTIGAEKLPFKINIIEACQNCKIVAREHKTENHKGMALHMQLETAKLFNNDEENMGGLTFQIEHKDVHDILVSLEDIPKYPSISIDNKTYRFALRRVQRTLPFSITLLDFKKESYMGTNMAKSYQSTVLIKDGDLQWESIIAMNAPLRYRGYTFFQSSFVQTPQGEISVLAAVWNVGRAFPYISGIAMCIGLVLHLYIRRRRLCLILLGVLSLITPHNSLAADKDNPTLNTIALAQIPILHEGRIKPLDSFARAALKKLSGHDHNAIAQLIEIVFDPARAEQRPLIKIINPELLSLLKLEPQKSRLYSYTDVFAALSQKQDLLLNIMNVDEKSWTQQHRDLITLQDKVITLRDLFSGLSLFLPLSGNLPQTDNPALHPYENKPFTYFGTLPIHTTLKNTVKHIVTQKGYDVSKYTETEQAMAQASFSLDALEKNGQNNDIFKIIHAEHEWVSPWSLINRAENHAASLNLWQSLALAYHNSNSTLWNETIARINQNAQTDTAVRHTAILAEYYYNLYNPFYINMVLSLIGLGLLILSLFLKKPILLPLAFLSLAGGLICQIAGIGARIYILERPPVSTLYETILFVTAVMSLYALSSYIKDKKPLWIWLCSTLGCFLSILGFAHHQDGDSFIMLSAVLNTNFWLATHVLCITTGYAFCVVTSVLAHFSILKMIWTRTAYADSLLFNNIQTAALFALFFATIGTVLGGVWADQSWGRFWGWDPKENGALLITLWLIWVIHGRISGQMGMIGTLFGLSYLCVILALSWFGVNILSVGLHAYGFTNSAAWVLGTFIAIETSFVIAAYLTLRIRERQNA